MNNLMFINKIHCEPMSISNWTKEADYDIKDHVDIWRVSLNQIKDKLRALKRYLTLEEMFKFSKFKQEGDRLRYLGGKSFLKILLARYLKCSPMDISFKEGINNKPMLNEIHGINFNLSHSNDWVVFGLCEEELGVDIEFIDSNFDFIPIINNWFSTPETHYIENAYSPRHEFFKLWTRKEALLKATSVGMTQNLNVINCLDGTQYVPYEVGAGFSDWRIKSLFFEELYSLSVTFPVFYNQIRLFEPQVTSIP
ncbi:4'-phosphopantetheinyl transferase superfamily protein [Echinicola jeungdonensis]|uniref:4'-phosphopantetheinyl transferase family protein n=1 Tax=Echinicola jeungdonensis TaxID=709343 RepID=A0ABV5J479_9BACT|nr:4'-phosphopantetheinyl transferase superfamily protein [Echinicola jeungdonensis]MDN3670063.1 4'-phosphopantetheinyl transferase superfamily protein [Echinicola jeungdonensis]